MIKQPRYYVASFTLNVLSTPAHILKLTEKYLVFSIVNCNFASELTPLARHVPDGVGTMTYWKAFTCVSS